MIFRTRRPMFSSSTQSTVFGWTAFIQFTIVPSCIDSQYPVGRCCQSHAVASDCHKPLLRRSGALKLLRQNRAFDHAENVVYGSIKHILKEICCPWNNYYQLRSCSWACTRLVFAPRPLPKLPWGMISLRPSAVVFSKTYRQKHQHPMIRSYKGITPTFPPSCYVDESAQLIGDVVLGENASVWMNAVLRGDVHYIRVGANSNIQDCSVLHGMLEKWPVVVGDWVTVGHSVTLHGCVVEDRCLIGMGVVILNGARIGAGSIIAAGTLIPEGTVVEPRSLWMGVPGKFRKSLGDQDQEMILQYGKNYIGYKEQYLKEREQGPEAKG